MPTYYEILQVSPAATVAEIETACEGQYNHWRRLVTHHDPNMVNKANQALQWLERIRATLTDPAKREEYDASIGLHGPVGGLADPQARPRVAVPTPPPPRPRSGPQSPPAPATGERVDAWTCPQCQAVSPVGTRFCKKCGQPIARECPQCDELVEVTAGSCSACGFSLRGYTPPLKLHTQLTAVEDKVSSRISKQLDNAVLPEWRNANLMTDEVSAAVKRGLVISLGMVNKSFRAQLSLSLRSEEPLQVQISSNSPWLTVSRTSLALEANQAQMVNVTVDAGGLQGGEDCLGEIKITAPEEASVAVVHHIMLGMSKFLGAGKAKNNLKSQLPRYLESRVLGPAFVEGILQEARQALVEGDSAGSAAAYAGAVRLLANPHTDPDLATPRLSKSPRVTALAQRWHRIARSLPERETLTPGLGWLNWDPQVSLGTRVPFHLLPLWRFAAEPSAASEVVPDLQERVLYPLSAKLAIDPLTGRAIKTLQPASALPTVGAGEPPQCGRNMAADGDFVAQIDGKHLVATQGKRMLWESQVGGLFGADGQVIMGRNHVYYYDGNRIRAFTRDSGKQVWQHNFNPSGTYNPPQFVEVNGYLLAMYVAIDRAGWGESCKYYHHQHLEWWNAETGAKQKQQFSIGRGKDDFEVDRLDVCYAVAPTVPEPFVQRPEFEFVFARLIIAYRHSIHEVLLFERESRLDFLPGWARSGGYGPGDKGMFMKWEYEFVIPVEEQILYMHMLGQHTCLVFSQGNIGPLQGLAHITAIDTQYSRSRQSRSVVFSGYFTKEDHDVFRNGTSAQKRSLLFDMTTVGGVLILRSRVKDSKERLLAFV